MLGGEKNPKFLYSLDSKVIPEADHVKDLGIHFSAEKHRSDIKFSYHCSKISKIAFSRAALILKSFSYKNAEFLMKLFIMYVRTILEYGSPVWNPYLIGDISLIERVQAYFVRNIPKVSKLCNYDARVAELGLVKLSRRRLDLDLAEAYKIIRGFSVLQFEDFFQGPSDNRTRTHGYKIKNGLANKNCRANFFSQRVVNVWNSLPPEIATASSLPVFKKLFREHRVRSLRFGSIDLATVT